MSRQKFLFAILSYLLQHITALVLWWYVVSINTSAPETREHPTSPTRWIKMSAWVSSRSRSGTPRHAWSWTIITGTCPHRTMVIGWKVLGILPPFYHP